ncbi:hypothetical protein BsWGS_06276 [Bradybaena similaris]
MASQATHSTSRIPLPVKSSPTPVHKPISGVYLKDFTAADCLSSPQEVFSLSRDKENGNIKVDKQKLLQSPQLQKGKGFETFLMTGEMMIPTNTPVAEIMVKQNNEGKTSKESHIPRLGHHDHPQVAQHPKGNKPQHQQLAGMPSPKLHSKIPGLVKNHSSQQVHTSSSHPGHHSAPSRYSSSNQVTMSGNVREFPLVYAPVAEMEELSDLSQSSCSESELGLEMDPESLPISTRPEVRLLHSQTIDDDRLDQAVESLLQPSLPGMSTGGLSDTSFSEAPSSGDSGCVRDGHTSNLELAGRGLITSQPFSITDSCLSGETLAEKPAASFTDKITHVGPVRHGQFENSSQTIVASNSGEKLSVHSGSSEQRLLVRTSKSHENYLQAGTNIALVSIDIDDHLAYSLDTLAYHDSLGSSLDNVTSEPLQMSRSLDNSPEKKSEKSSTIEHEFLPGLIKLDDSKPVKLKLNKPWQDCDDDRLCQINNSGNFCSNFSSHTSSSHVLGLSSRGNDEGQPDGGSTSMFGPHNCEQLRLLGVDVDSDSLYHQPSKAVDRPSAERLAKRLFLLEGFRKSDVSRHLCKKNDFSNLVAEEYLKFFDFQEDTLDQALRKFLLRFSLYGETQERERVLAHFSHRFMECNPGSFNSEDACHTLTCAIMLLNSDLHSPNVGRRMTCQEFIENLAALNDGENFSKEVLKAIYQAIKNEPIEWALDDLSPEQEGGPLPEQLGSPQSPSPSSLGSNPFLEVPDPSKTTEYKKGYVMRKCCMEPARRRTPFGKRGWKMLYAVLRDMILYQYKDEHQLKKGHFVESTHNAIRIHHALAVKALDYTKKQHVFRLQTADGAEYLFQTGDSKELQEWVDTINLVAASLSAPVLPGAVGSKAQFQRQLLPSSCTRLSLREQLHSHETKVEELEQDLLLHRADAPEKGAKSSVIQEYLDKESYLEFEIKRFKTYVCLLQAKVLACPQLEASLVETTIGECEELGAGTSHLLSDQTSAQPGSVMKPVQRSMSDRYCYKAAIYHTDHIEYDVM